MKAFVSSLLLSTFVAASASAAPILFDNRDKVNLLNSDLVSITSNRALTVEQFRSGFLEEYVDFGANPAAKDWITIDFGAVRNVKTIKMANMIGTTRALSMATARIEISGDGTTWTTVDNTAVHSGSGSIDLMTFVLNAAQDTRYLRVTADTYNNNTAGGDFHRVLVNSMKVFGDTGTLEAGEHLDVVSAAAFSAANAVTLTSTGMTTSSGATKIATDFQGTGGIERHFVYGGGVGDTVVLKFDREIEFSRFGFSTPKSATYYDGNAEFRLYISADGVSFDPTPVYIIAAGSHAWGINYFDIPDTTGKAIKFEIASTGKTTLGFSDFQVFVPEPASMVLLAAGSLVLLRRRR